jgi:phosphoserine phosphatase RsbU/P
MQRDPDTIDQWLKLIEQATDEVAEGIVITDAQQPDNPIIYANMGFQRITGYSREFIVGKNCRFLQGKDTDPDALNVIRNAVQQRKPCVVELLNYRNDKTPFWNRLSITPLFDGAGEIKHFVGVQSDITELKRTRDELETVNRSLQQFYDQMTGELHRAKQAMESILPQQMPHSHHLKIAARFHPLTEIGGDFFDVFEISDDVYGILIADVTGHGIPAALLSYMALNTFKKTAAGIFSSRDVIESTNDSLHKNLPEGNFISMFYMIFDTGKQSLTYTQAGHPPGLLIRHNPPQIEILSTSDILVGLFSRDQVQFSEKSLPLKPGDKVLIYTDAIIETDRDAEGPTGEDWLIEFLKDHADLNAQELIDQLYHHGLERSGNHQYDDDLTLICLELTGA